MLRALELRDLAIVDELRVEFAPGLNVLTGETGAGKSIVVDALAILAGARPDSALIRAGAESALVQGEFDALEITSAARRLAANGRHSARLNGELVPVAELAERCGALIAVFAQHGALELQTPTAQRRQLDRLLTGPERELLTGHAAAFQRHAELAAELEQVRTDRRERARRQENLEYQLADIDKAALRPGEDDALLAELDSLQHAERIVTGASQALSALSSAEPSATALAAAALRDLQAAARYAAPLQALAHDLSEAVTGLSAVAGEVEAFLSDFDADPTRLEVVQGRLAVIEGLKRKYGEGVAAVLAFREQVADELASLAGLDADEARLADEAAALAGELASAADALTRARQTAAGRLGDAVGPLLRQLGMPNASFAAAISPLQKPGPAGRDMVVFHFSANAGEPPAPLTAVASGGELSRLMLALHLETGSDFPCLVFDEIDAGIGGATSRAVGELLKRLAADHQVLVVTHLAQVAAYADAHFVVRKEDLGGRTVARVIRLAQGERAPELARMLSGTVTDASLRHASELLEGSSSVSPARHINLA